MLGVGCGLCLSFGSLAFQLNLLLSRLYQNNKNNKHLSTFLTSTEETTLYHIIRQKILLIIMIMLKKNLWRLGSGEYLEDFFCVKPSDIPVIGKEYSP